MSFDLTIDKLSVHWQACITCGVLFGITQEHRSRLENNHTSYCCPNKHEQYYPAAKERAEDAEKAERERNGGLTFKELKIQSAHAAEQAEAKISELHAKLNGGTRPEIVLPDDPSVTPEELHAMLASAWPTLSAERRAEITELARASITATASKTPPVIPPNAAAAQSPPAGKFTVITGAVPVIFKPADGETVCTLCGRSFHFQQTLERHLKRDHQREDAGLLVSQFYCKLPSERVTVRIADAILDGKRLVCQHCGKPFKDHLCAVKHFAKEHGILETESRRAIAQVVYGHGVSTCG